MFLRRLAPLILTAFVHADDRATLLDGVNELPTTGAPGGVCAVGPEAFAVIAGKEGKTLSPVVAATRWDMGRVVAFGHNGYLGLTSDPDAARLLTNAVTWAAGGAKAKVGVRVNNALAEHLEAQGFKVERLEGIDWPLKLRGLAALCVDAHSLDMVRDVQAVATFVREGGGLVTAATGWGWAQTHPGKTLADDFPGNALLRPAGLVFNSRTPDRTGQRGYIAGGESLELLNTTRALDALVAHEEKRTPLEAAALAQAGDTISTALQSLPGDDPTFTTRIAALAKRPGAFVLPTEKQPLKSDQPLARLLLAYAGEQLKRAKPEALKPHPAAASFPGEVPRNAKPETRNLNLDTSVPGWHSTGLYAAPGALLRIKIPADAARQGFRVRIGCHNDKLWHLAEWRRVPDITVSTPLDAAQTAAANSFGGSVYIEVPEKGRGFTLPVAIEGAVAAPHYALGKTTRLDWLQQRAKPGPWAEIECGRVILSVPSSAIRALEDPEPLARFWDSIVAAEDELAGTLAKRNRPERIVPDVQISAGYMHSGYPIMTWMDVIPASVDVEKMRAGSWGHFHELGHNQQSADWTFEGTGEVTCNIFALYVVEKLCGKPPGTGHDAMEPGKVLRRMEQHLRGESAAKFARWKGDPFLALTMYAQLRAAFGWEAYQKVFAEYRDLPAAARPKTDQAKRDQWMVRFSKTVGRNLGPFFDGWGVPVTDGARAEIASLPPWMPTEWPAN
ncbi:MAG: M60 family metallopeptidase [Chthoniobacteraceae bacterium]